MPAVWASTHPELTLLRLHGRNAAAWNRTTQASSGRFRYEYSEAELAELAERFSRLAAQSAQAHAVFNTNFEDQGVRNAAAFARRRCRGSETRSPMRSCGSGAGRARRLARHFRQAVQQHLELARDVLLGHAGNPSSSPGRRSAGSA